MSLDDDAHNAGTLTLLDAYAFKSDLLTMMNDTGLETNDHLKRRARAVPLEMGSTIASVVPHGVRTSDLLDAMMEGPEKAGLSSGVRYAAAAIIVAHQKGKADNTSASELSKLAQDWLLFFLWPFKKAYKAAHSPQSTPALRVSEVIADIMPAASRNSRFRDLIGKRDGDKCVVTGALNIYKNYPLDNQAREGLLHTAHILQRSIFHKHSRRNRIAGTIDIIKHYTRLPEKIMGDLVGIIDSPENGMTLDVVMHDLFDSYMWCLHPTDVSHRYTVHWFRRVPAGMRNFTKVQFQDHSQTGIQLPNPTFIALHSTVAHVLHLGGAAEVIDKVYDAFSDERPTVSSRNHASEEDFLIRLSLIGLTTNKHQLPTNPHEIQ